jgi:hypothetical protein
MGFCDRSVCRCMYLWSSRPSKAPHLVTTQHSHVLPHRFASLSKRPTRVVPQRGYLQNILLPAGHSAAFPNFSSRLHEHAAGPPLDSRIRTSRFPQGTLHNRVQTRIAVGWLLLRRRHARHAAIGRQRPRLGTMWPGSPC